MNTELFHQKIYPIFTPNEKKIREAALNHNGLALLVLQKYKKVCTCNSATDNDIMNLEYMIKTWMKENDCNNQ
jgi:hypothetical protein